MLKIKVTYIQQVNAYMGAKYIPHFTLKKHNLEKNSGGRQYIWGREGAQKFLKNPLSTDVVLKKQRDNMYTSRKT